jgi:tripartite-type tricarboxylate transporter receptor subunit TctC
MRLVYLVASVLLASVIGFAAQSLGQEFYKGKTVRFIVGFSPGGGFDVYTRLIARHINAHIPGHPQTLVENMPGAGSLIAANHLYNRVKPDGLTIGNWVGGLILQQVIGTGKGIEFDARKFEWIGVPVSGTQVCALAKRSGIASLAQWSKAKEAVKLGGEAPGSTTYDIPRVLKAALNLPIRPVGGYKGTADIRLAVESGEIDGSCLGWDSLSSTWQKSLEVGDVVVVLQAAPKPHFQLHNTPLAIDFARTDEARRLIQAGIHDPAALIRPYSLPPGTPKDRVKILRDSFMTTMKDADFLAEAKKAKLEIGPGSGEEVEKIIADYFGLAPGLIAKLKEALTAGQ